MEEILTPKQELFCRYYTQNNELFGNGTLAYAEAYEYKLDELSKEKPIVERDAEGKPKKEGDSEYTLAYNTCSVQASRMLRNGKIQDRLTTLLNEYLKNEVVDAQLLKIIIGGKDTDKVSAIREYNRLRQRIVEKTDITSKGEQIKSSTGENIEEIAKKVSEELKKKAENDNKGTISGA